MKMTYARYLTLSQRSPVESLPEAEVDGVLLVGSTAVVVYESGHERTGHDVVSLFPAFHGGEQCWFRRATWHPSAGYSACGTHEEIVAFGDGVRLLCEREVFRLPPPVLETPAEVAMTTTTNLIAAPRFTRRDRDASEVLAIVRAEDRHGNAITSSFSEQGPEYPYLVQVTSGPDVGDDFVGLYTLDGDKIDQANGWTWEIVSEAPIEVIEAIEIGWATGTSVVERAAMAQLAAHADEGSAITLRRTADSARIGRYLTRITVLPGGLHPAGTAYHWLPCTTDYAPSPDYTTHGWDDPPIGVIMARMQALEIYPGSEVESEVISAEGSFVELHLVPSG